ncbi:hypothetical protein GCM10022237_39300 [Nocardioides ginsengisoli]
MGPHCHSPDGRWDAEPGPTGIGTDQAVRIMSSPTRRRPHKVGRRRARGCPDRSRVAQKP